jgi:lysophospholipase L1-like esterase
MKWLLISALIAGIGGDAISRSFSDGIGKGSRAVRASTLTIDAMPFTRTVTCTGSITMTGSATGSISSVSWSASPSGASGACTGTTSWSCAVAVAPDAVGEGVEVITVSTDLGGSDTETVGFYFNGASTCFNAQNINGSYNSGLVTGQNLNTWENLGSSGLDGTSSTNKPKYAVSLFSGIPYVMFDGDDYFAAGVAANWLFLSQTPSSTDAAYLLYTDNGLYQSIYSAYEAGTNRGAFFGVDMRTTNTGDVTLKQSTGQAQNTTDPHIVARLHQMHGIRLDTVGVDLTLYLDSASTATASGVTNEAVSVNTMHIGGLASGTAIKGMTGRVFNVLFYGSDLSATQRGINNAVNQWALDGTFPFIDVPTGTYLFTGDSISVSWPTNLANYTPTGPTFSNIAVAGETTSQMLTRVLAEPAPDVIFVLGGINDILTGVAVATAFSNLEAIYNDAKSQGAYVVALKVLPFGDYSGWDATKQANVEALNALIAGSSIPDIVLDTYTEMQDPADLDALLPAYANADGLHLIAAGNAALAKFVSASIGL